jgi:hypothetical protein
MGQADVTMLSKQNELVATFCLGGRIASLREHDEILGETAVTAGMLGSSSS